MRYATGWLCDEPRNIGAVNSGKGPALLPNGVTAQACLIPRSTETCVQRNSTFKHSVGWNFSQKSKVMKKQQSQKRVVTTWRLHGITGNTLLNIPTELVFRKSCFLISTDRLSYISRSFLPSPLENC
jgi:hypothetical protein